MRLVLLYATLLLAASTKYTTIYVDALPLSPDSIAKLNSSSNQTAQASLDYVKLVRRLKTNSDSTFELSVIKNLDPMVKINNNKRLVKPVTGYEATGIKAAKEAKLTGQGINIGIIDSGIDYLHPALGGCFGKECRVAVGMNLYGRSIADIHSRKDRGDPMDCYGHGTKVAGIIGAQTNTFVGIAPKATLGAYRIAGCDESAANEGLIKL
ncbi:peptidase S8/S53 domain-containing protein, partial [Syncephalis fuscata]